MKKKLLMLLIVVGAACLAAWQHNTFISLLSFTAAGEGCLLLWLLGRHVDYLREYPPLGSPEPSATLGPGLVANWKLDAIEGGMALDASGNGLHGKLGRLLDFPLFSKPSLAHDPQYKSLLFNGRQWVAAGNKACFAVEQFSVTAWVWRQKQSLDQEPKLVPTIIAKSTWPSSGWWLCATFNSLEIDMGISYGEGFTHVKSGYSLPFEEWHFIGVTMDNLKHEVQFFIDGKPFGEKILNVKQWVTNWDRALYIGEYDGTCRWPWVGKLNDVRFYNLILSETEIAAIYEQNRLQSQAVTGQ